MNSSKTLLAIFIICFFEMNTFVHGTNQTSKKSFKPVVESRQFGGESNNFKNWKIWDRPEDQLAIESLNLGNSHHNNNIYQSRTQRLLRNHTVPASPEVVYNMPKSSSSGDMNYNGMQRNDCNSNLQVSFLPVILAIIAVVAGIIGIIVLWFIAKAFVSTGGSNGVGYGGPGWTSNHKRFDTSAFGRNFKNFDFDQLTNLVMKGIEGYKKAFETSEASG